MKGPYLLAQEKSPLPSLGGSRVRPRPVIAIGVAGPHRTLLVDGLLDTGSDETVLEEWVATAIGADLNVGPQRLVGLVGRTNPILCRYAPISLQVTDGRDETYRWNAMIGFVSTPLRDSRLGYAGFLQFFDAEFRGADQMVVLKPNSSFPGECL